MLEFALAENFDTSTVDGDVTWLEALPARVYHTPIYGKIRVDSPKLERMVKGFKENIRGQEIAVNYDHGLDTAKGNKAAGWYRDMKIDTNAAGEPTLKVAVQFTDEAKQEIKGGAWKYFSMEWDDEWMANDGSKHKDVIVGGAITNRPVAKGMEAIPVNFSETHYEKMTDAEKADFKKNILRVASLKIAKEHNFNEEVIDRIESGELVLVDEQKEWEHSEPGTGPVPRTDEDGSDDPAITERWRREPLPVEELLKVDDKGDTALNEDELKQLKEALGLAEDATTETILTTAKTQFSEAAEAKTLRETVNAANEEQRFAEQYPTLHKQMREDRAKIRENDAKTFSESVEVVTRTEGEKQVPAGKGLSALALQKVAETHMKFAEGSVTLVDFEDAIKTIVNGGLVDFSENGSRRDNEEIEINTTTAAGVAAARKLFAEKVSEIQTQDKLEYDVALAEAAKRYPELAQAYSQTVPA